MRRGGAQIYETQLVLERESRLLKAELAAFTHQAAIWAANAKQLQAALKQVGAEHGPQGAAGVRVEAFWGSGLRRSGGQG